jgi:chromosome segregation ATPase
MNKVGRLDVSDYAHALGQARAGLGGLLSSQVDEGTDALTSTPAGIKSAYRMTRDKWKKQYHDVRDAVSQLFLVMEQKRQETAKLEKEAAELEVMKKGAIEKFKSTREEKYQQAFQAAHVRQGEVQARLSQLTTEVADIERQTERYKLKLTEMQRSIQDLDKQEAEAIADIVSSKQIVELNDRMSNLSTTLHDENLQAIEKNRQKMKAKAKLSDELVGSDTAQIESEIMAAGMSGDAMDEFNKMLAESEMKAQERAQSSPQTERTM